MVYRERDGENEKPKKILCTAAKGLGNLVEETPALQAIREMFPDSEITFFIPEMWRGIYEGWPVVNLVTADPPPMTGWDAVVHFTPPCIVYGKQFEGKQILDISVEKMKYNSEINVNLKAVLKLDMDFRAKNRHRTWHTYFPTSETALPKKREEWIAFAPGCRTENLQRKDYGAKKWAKVLTELLKETTAKIFLVGGPDDTAILDHLNPSSRIVDCLGKYTIKETGYLISKCDCMIGNDTGLAHVASALDIPSVIFFGPTSILKNKPQNKCAVVSRHLECSELCQWGSGCRIGSCRDIDSSVFVTAVKRVLDATGKKSLTEKFKFGTWMTTHDRYPFLAATLKSIVDARIPEPWKFVFIDDASEDERIIPLLEEAAEILRKKGHEVEIKRNEVNAGKEKYGDTIRAGFDALNDCEYAVPIQDDFLLAVDFFEKAVKASEHLDDTTKIIYLISYLLNNETDKEIAPGIVDAGDFVEWWPAVWEPNFWRDAQPVCHPSDGGSGANTIIYEQLVANGYRTAKLKRSAGIHLGEIISSLNTEHRKAEPIRTHKPNIFGRQS